MQNLIEILNLTLNLNKNYLLYFKYSYKLMPKNEKLENGSKSDNNNSEKEKQLNLETFEVFHEIKIAYSRSGLDNTFVSFLFCDIPYLVFATREKSIISYNLNNLCVVTEVKRAHEEDITNFRQYQKKIKEIYILSVSGIINDIKVWNFKNWECIFHLNKRKIIGSIFSACYIYKDNKDYVITSNSNDTQYIQLYDFTGKEFLTLNDSKGKVTFLDYFYDKEKSKYYIIAGYDDYSRSFDLEENKLYHKYYDKDMSTDWHGSLKINFSDNIVKLIDTNWEDDYLMIWDFHKGTLLSKFKTGGKTIRCLCEWDEYNYFVGDKDHSIKLVDIKNGKVIKTFNAHIDWVVTIKKIKIDKYGECLVSMGLSTKENIKIWKMKE